MEIESKPLKVLRILCVSSAPHTTIPLDWNQVIDGLFWGEDWEMEIMYYTEGRCWTLNPNQTAFQPGYVSVVVVRDSRPCTLRQTVIGWPIENSPTNCDNPEF